MKKDNLLLFYILLFFSSGLYLFIWQYQVENLLKQNNCDVVMASKKHVALSVLTMIGLLFIASLLEENLGYQVGEQWFMNGLIGLATIATLFSVYFLLNNLIQINTFFREELRLKTPNNLSVIVLFFFFYISPILIQRVVNKEITKK